MSSDIFILLVLTLNPFKSRVMNIQKFLFVTVLFFSTLNAGNAQSSQAGDITIQAGIGLLPTYFKDASNVKVIPVQAAISYKLLDFLSIGAFAGYSEYQSNVQEMYNGSTFQTTTESILGGARIAAHAKGMNKVDIYGGFQVGYSKPTVTTQVLSVSEANGGNNVGPRAKVRDEFVYSGFLGATTYLTKNIGLYGEIGFGISLINVGATLKI